MIPTEQDAKELYRDLRLFGPFSALPNQAIEEICASCQRVRISAGKSLRRPDGARKEWYYFLVAGQIKVEQTTSLTDDDGDPQQENIALFLAGDVFSDGYLDHRGDASRQKIDCVAQTEAKLFALPQAAIGRLLRAHPQWAAELQRSNQSLRHHFLGQKLLSRKLIQDFFLRHGFSYATRVRVVQLDRCIKCLACQNACEARHGVARFAHMGARLGRLSFPAACRDCTDPRCVKACSFGALIRDEQTGQVRIEGRCAGCTACARACPSAAITMAEIPYTAEDFPVAVPQSDRSGSTNVGGLYVIGDASGDALIKIAINAGKEAVDHIVAQGRPSSGENQEDVIIIGSGPAGLSAALSCREQQLRFRIFDKGSIASTIQNYPKKKLVMAEPAHLPQVGRLWFRDATKEELVAKWCEILDETGIEVCENVEVKKVTQRAEGGFLVDTAQGSHQASKVIFAVGTRGAPRKLGVAGESEPRVQYLLTDPDLYAGKKVLVVGGGDSALEAAMSLAEVDGTEVGLSYRRDSFGRAKPLNRQRLAEFESRGQVRVFFKSTVKNIEKDHLCLSCADEECQLDNDVIFAMLGAEPPTKFLRDAGILVLEPGTEQMAEFAAGRGKKRVAVRCDNCHGYADRACLAACPTGALTEVAPAEIFIDVDGEQGADRGNYSEVPFLLGIEEHRLHRARKLDRPWIQLSLLLLLVVVGMECFLRRTLPDFSLQAFWQQELGREGEIFFASGRGLGHWLGYVGTVMMLLTLLYPLRSHLGWFPRLSKRAWLLFHAWFGLAGAAFVTYHSLFKLDRWVALSLWATWLVVLSGLFGKYLFGWVHSGIGLAEFEKRTLEGELGRLRSDLGEGTGLGHLFDSLAPAQQTGSSRFLTGPWRMFWLDISSRVRFRWMRWFGLRHIKSRARRRETVRLLADRARNVRSLRYLELAKKFLSTWNRIHLVLTVVMILLSGLHIVFALMYKAN